MSFETQSINEAEFKAEIENQATVAKFKNRFAELRAFKSECFQRLKNLRDTLQKMSEERAYILSMFDNEAIQMYPELTLDTIGPTLAQVDSAHPLSVLWEQYSLKLEALDQDAGSATEAFSVNEDEYVAADQEELTLIESYVAFADQATTLVPSVEELTLMLESEEAIPQVDEKSLIADISAINILSPEAADMITLEQVDQDEQIAKIEAEQAIQDYDRSLDKQYNPLGIILALSAAMYALFA